MRVIITDGGRATAGYKSAVGGDCVARSIAIVSGLPYKEPTLPKMDRFRKAA